MLRNALRLVVVLALVGPLGTTLADDKDRPALTGAWMKKGGEVRIEFSDKEVMKVYPHADREVLTIICKYTIEKGRVQARITEHEGKAREKVVEKLPVGFRFSFAWKAKGDTATLDDVKGENV